MKLYQAISSSGVVSTEVVNSLLGVYVNSTQPLVTVDIFNAISRAASSTAAAPSTPQTYEETFRADKVTYTILFVSMVKFLSKELSPIPANVAVQDSDNTDAPLARRISDQIDLIMDRLIQVVARQRTDSRSSRAQPSMLPLVKIYNLIDLDSSNNAAVEDIRYSAALQASNITSSLGISDLDSILYSVFYKMRYTRGVKPDLLMMKVLNSLFAMQRKNIRNFVGGDIKRIFSQDTARFVLDELIIAGEREIAYRLISVYLIFFPIFLNYFTTILRTCVLRIPTSADAGHTGMLRIFGATNGLVLEGGFEPGQAAAVVASVV